jgi:hypothetical protein
VELAPQMHAWLMPPNKSGKISVVFRASPSHCDGTINRRRPYGQEGDDEEEDDAKDDVEIDGQDARHRAKEHEREQGSSQSVAHDSEAAYASAR